MNLHYSINCTVTVAAILLSAFTGARAAPLANPSAHVPDEWLTLVERTNFVETPRLDETLAYCKRLAEASPWIEYTVCGISPEGREIGLVVLSKDGAFTPEAARAANKLVVFANNGIHPGEIEGKDASLMLMRDMAITKTRAALLDHVVFIVMPIFSVDGHERFGPYHRINQNGPKEMGWRVTSQYLNLNRDFMKADAPEMHAWLKVWNEWNPDLHFDNHTSDGGDWQYDLTFATATQQTASPEIAAWVKDTCFPRLFPALEADGHIPYIYFDFRDGLDPMKGIASGAFSPRFSTGYAALRNRPSILVETHMLKDYRTRVIGHYNIMKRTLEELNRDPSALREATRAADAATVAMGRQFRPDFKLPIVLKEAEKGRPIKFKGVAWKRELSEISGGMRILYDPTTPVEFDIEYFDGTEVAKEIVPPLGYLIPPQWTEVIERTERHGLKMERLTKPVTVEVESYRFDKVRFAASSFEGHHEVSYEALPIKEKRTYLPGSVYIPLDQPAAKVAIYLFEPETPDSFMAWGFFSATLEQKEYGEAYVMEKVAREMIAADPALKTEFEEKVRTDPAFAASPTARLDFFYRKSPWWDPKLNVYPVGRVTTQPEWARTSK